MMQKQYVIDPRLDSYQSFFDHAWGREIDRIVSGSPLELIVFDLRAAWKAASLTHRLPWLTMEIFKSFATSYDNAREPITKMVIEQIALDMSAKLRLTQTKRQELDKILEEIRKKVLNTDRPPETIISGFVIDKMWQSLLPNFEFNGSVWASQRLCYGAVYYAYEDFLVRTYRLAIGKPDYRMKFAKEFARDLAKAFSVELSDFCFSGEVDVARRARNALAHSGGRITEELREIGHAFPVVNGEIQITTAHTRALFDLLKERVAKLVPEALKRLPGQHT